MAQNEYNHFSPVFANSYWTSELAGQHYTSFFRCERRRSVRRKPVGRKKWGGKRKLYRKQVELNLNRELETPVAGIYQALVEGRSLSEVERRKWAQFLLSQFVRTPTFMRYESAACKMLGLRDAPTNDRVGCEDCLDLHLLLDRRWVVLNAPGDQFFIRTDNPVLLTGFLEDNDSTLFYPLTPKRCFVACTRPSIIVTLTKETGYTETCLEEGEAFIINFYLSKAADESVIIHPGNENSTITTMLRETLGVYPQVPYLLHTPTQHEILAAYSSVTEIMSLVDGASYPIVLNELRSYYGGQGELNRKVLGF